MTTLSDVAREAGVSISVASRVLNSDASLRARPDTRERVRKVAAELKYRPNYAARSLRLSQTRTIGLFMPDVTNPIVAEVLQGVDDGANDSDVQVLLGRIERLEHSVEGLRRLIGEGRIDGLLVQLSDGLEVEEFEKVATESTTPVVLLHSKGTRPGSVVLDDATGAKVATQHLIDLGHTDIAFLGALPQSQSGARRKQGFLAAMKAADLRVRRGWVTSYGYLPFQGRAAGEAVLSKRVRPTGVVVANINAAAGVMAAAHALGLRIPEDLSVVAIHDTWFADYLFPRLTTVRMPLNELGRQSLEMIIGVLRGQPRRDHMIVDPAPVLQVRDSTTSPAR
jgi:LacI family transcriptional regulator